MAKTPSTSLDPEMQTIIPDTGVEHTKMDAEMAYLKKNNTGKAIRHKPRKKYVYETDMQNIYNIIVVQTNEQLQEKAELEATFQTAKTGREPIGYLIILNKLWF